jgi:hypothetical protein
VQRGSICGDLEMVLVGVHRITMPSKGLAVCFEANSGDIENRTFGTVSAGDPLGGDEVKRSGMHRKVDVSAVKLTGRIGKICMDLDWGLLAVYRREACGE